MKNPCQIGPLIHDTLHRSERQGENSHFRFALIVRVNDIIDHETAVVDDGADLQSLQNERQCSSVITGYAIDGA